VNRKVPIDAFSYYVSLGPRRSYQAVADKFGVSKRTVTNTAARENWQPRIADVERRARERSDDTAVETLEEMNRRHLKAYRFIQSRAIEALKSMPLDSAMDAVRAYDRAAQGERLARGEPTERTEIEEIIRREYDLCMRPVDEPDPGNDASAEPDEPVGTERDEKEGDESRASNDAGG
jgi:hypothetical protein